jgi:NADH-quinone oxidoreductase subunit N
MTAQDLLSLLPLISLFGTTALVMLLIAYRRSHGGTAFLSILGLLGALFSTYFMPARLELYILLMQAFLIAGILLLFFTYEYFKAYHEPVEEFYLLLLLGIAGALVIISCDNFVSLFLGVELLTIPAYCLVAYTFTRTNIEAAVKYIILASFAAAMMLFGIALVYASFGTMNFVILNQLLAQNNANLLFLGGMALIFAALAFKISAVPFHIWTPDVYDGSPLPALGFLATISKAASLIVILRLWLLAAPFIGQQLGIVLTIMAILSMLAGNILALRQDNIKRLIAYSSIAHFGYLTMAVIAAGEIGIQAVLLYLVAYVITIFILLGVLIMLDKPIDNIYQLKNFFSQQPILAAMFLLALFSLMGLPLTALFMGKLLIILASIQHAQWLLVGSLILSSSIGIFVYLRVVNIILDTSSPALLNIQKNNIVVSSFIIFLALSLVILGVWPTPLTNSLPKDAQSLLLK